MTPTAALKQIAKVKKHIEALELALSCPGLKEGEDCRQDSNDLEQLRKLLFMYQTELKDWNLI